jgi:hypothetical protein
MKKDKGGWTDFLALPAEEAERTLEALKQAEQTNDIEALKWCARRLAWLDDTSEIESGDDEFYRERLFNKAWADQLKADPPPDSVAGIIARIDQEDEPEQPDNEQGVLDVFRKLSLEKQDDLLAYAESLAKAGAA